LVEEDYNMTVRDNRSMNYDLSVGAVEGKVRFLRPHAVDADESHALQRSYELHPSHYGSMGISMNNRQCVLNARPDSSMPPSGGPRTWKGVYNPLTVAEGRPYEP
jgi:hypothetical protein